MAWHVTDSLETHAERVWNLLSVRANAGEAIVMRVARGDGMPGSLVGKGRTDHVTVASRKANVSRAAWRRPSPAAQDR